MSTTVPIESITQGDDVFGADNEKVGAVAEVQAGYIVVEKGFFFPTDYYVPMSAIASAGDGRVYLNVTKDAALNSGWDVVPEAGYVATDTDYVATETVTTDTRSAATRQSDDEIHIPVIEEELTATVRSAETGAVRVEKDVITEERTLEVPVTEERLRVERRVVDRPVSAADAGILEETVIEVPLYGEEVEVQKRARVAEEVVLSKEAVQRTEQVSGTVRREEVRIEEDSIVDPTLVDDTTRTTDRG